MAYAIFDENLYLIREREVFHSEVCYLLVFHMLCQRYRLLLFFLFFYLFIYLFFCLRDKMISSCFGLSQTELVFLNFFLIKKLMNRLTIFRNQNLVLELKISIPLVQILFLVHRSLDSWPQQLSKIIFGSFEIHSFDNLVLLI